MKKKSVFFSLVLFAIIVFNCTIPTFATVHTEIKLDECDAFMRDELDENDALFQCINKNVFGSVLDSLNPNLKDRGAKLYSDFSNNGLSRTMNTKSESSHSKNTQVNSRSVRNVSNFAELSAALSDSTVYTINILNSFAMTSVLTISRDIDFINGSGNDFVTLTATGSRHFQIINQNDLYITFEDVVLDGDETGGGIDIFDSYVTIENACIQYCYTNNNDGGGAILAYNESYNPTTEETVPSGSLELIGGTFGWNSAEIGGGSIASYGQLDVSNATISNSNTAKSGGGIMICNFSDYAISSTLKTVIVEDNTADLLGGGIVLAGVTATIQTQCQIKGNEAASGGGICSISSNTTVRQSTVTNNIALDNSSTMRPFERLGGAGLYGVGYLKLVRATVTNNKVASEIGYGSGVLMIPKTYDPELSNYTGVEKLEIGTSSTMSGNKSTNNSVNATLYGGAVATIQVAADIQYSDIQQNEATYGGGIYCGGTTQLLGGTVYNNTASVNGGGVYATKAMTMAQTVISDNTADQNGGGVFYNSALSTWTMNSGSISNNVAHGDGGGFYGMGPRMKFVMNGGTISFNLAGYEEDDPEFDTDSNVHYGGGVYLGEGIGGCSITGGSITYNTATYGGGVYTVRNMSLTGGSITGNYAMSMNGLQPLGKGGGLYIADTAIVENIGQPCQIINNIADLADPVYGYNVWVEPGAQYIII